MMHVCVSPAAMAMAETPDDDERKKAERGGRGQRRGMAGRHTQALTHTIPFTGLNQQREKKIDVPPICSLQESIF